MRCSIHNTGNVTVSFNIFDELRENANLHIVKPFFTFLFVYMYVDTYIPSVFICLLGIMPSM